MIRFIECLILMTVLGSVSQALVDNTQLLLTKTDTFLKGQEFALAFSPSQEIQFETLECIGRWGCSNPIRSLAKIEVVKEGEVVINQFGANNNLRARDRVQQAQWENIHRNYLRAKLSFMESFGFKVTINEFSEITCPSRVFVSTHDQCVQVKAIAINSLGHRSDYTFILWRSPSALGQILESIQADSKPIVRTIKYQLTAFKYP